MRFELQKLEATTTKSCNIFVITVTTSLASVQVILAPYCCLFCVLSSDMLNVSIGIFS